MICGIWFILSGLVGLGESCYPDDIFLERDIMEQSEATNHCNVTDHWGLECTCELKGFKTTLLRNRESLTLMQDLLLDDLFLADGLMLESLGWDEYWISLERINGTWTWADGSEMETTDSLWHSESEKFGPQKDIEDRNCAAWSVGGGNKILPGVIVAVPCSGKRPSLCQLEELVWGPWSEWGPYDKTCGDGAKKTRTRNSLSGHAIGSDFETVNLSPCPISSSDSSTESFTEGLPLRFIMFFLPDLLF